MAGNTRRMLVYGSNTLIVTIVFIAILVFAALIAERHPWRVDFTESGSFTLSEQTKKILAATDKPITVKVFFDLGDPGQMMAVHKAQDLLETYRAYNRNITFEVVDPDRQPEAAHKYNVRTFGTVVLEGYDKTESIPEANEESLTNAILKLSTGQQKKIYFLTGHGEHDIESEEKDGYSHVRSTLEKDNYAVETLGLLQQAQVPEDAAVLIVAGPKKSLMPQEIERLKGYLDRGGKLFVLLDPQNDGGLVDFLKGYGIEANDDIVVDEISRAFEGSYLMPVVLAYGHHKITENFKVMTFYPEARSIQAAKEPPKGVELETLAFTSEYAWAEKNLGLLGMGQVGFDEGEDLAGPVPLVVLAEIALDEGKEEVSDHAAGKSATLLVAGDSDFVGNTNKKLGNTDLFMNMVNFLAGDEKLITIERREKEAQLLMLTQAQGRIVGVVTLGAMPLLVLLAWLAVYRVRRAQR